MGWKVLETKNGDVHKYECTACAVTMLFLPQTELKVWCCNRWVRPEPETKRNKLPREMVTEHKVRQVPVPFEVTYESAIPSGQRTQWQETERAETQSGR